MIVEDCWISEFIPELAACMTMPWLPLLMFIALPVLIDPLPMTVTELPLTLPSCVTSASAATIDYDCPR